MSRWQRPWSAAQASTPAPLGACRVTSLVRTWLLARRLPEAVQGLAHAQLVGIFRPARKGLAGPDLRAFPAEGNDVCELAAGGPREVYREDRQSLCAAEIPGRSMWPAAGTVMQWSS